MNKLIAGLCCLMLAVPPLALAQGASPTKKPAPLSQKELKAKEKALHRQMGQCVEKALGKGLKPGTRAFEQFLTGCLRE